MFHVKGKTHLVIPDAHATPGEDLRRFEWLGKLILEVQPDVIVDIGDWWDMASLCSYDKGTKSFEGRRYKADIEAGHRADQLAFGPIVEYNKEMSKQKRKKYNPVIIRTRGNHEHRIGKAVERQAELEGVIGFEDLNPRLDLDFRVFPFLQPVTVDGITYCHYFVSGVMGRPVSSASAMLAKQHVSCTAGHLHLKDSSEGRTAQGKRIRSLICGSFHDPDHVSHYANEQSAGLWWDGLILKYNVENGDYDSLEISVNNLQLMMEGKKHHEAKSQIIA